MWLSNFCLLAAAVGTANAGITYKGSDWSSVAVEERARIEYRSTEGGPVEPLERIMAKNGMNIARQRLWVTEGHYGLTYNIALAKRAQAAGLAVHIDMHFSATWADPGKQAIPEGWPHDLKGLAAKLYAYTRDVSNALHAEGIAPVIMDLGNEITNGMLWPVGSFQHPNNLALLLKSAAQGVRESSLKPTPKLAIHTHEGADWGMQRNFFDQLLSAGPLSADDFDIIALSYYPLSDSHGALADLKTSVQGLAQKYKKPVHIAETNWANECTPAPQIPADLRDVPISAAGQVEFTRRLAQVLIGANIPGSTALQWWEFAWVNSAALGSQCQSKTLFQYSGVALPSISLFKRL